MPRNLTGIAMGKSTYARASLLVNTTPLEAGWVGRLVVELANLADLPLRIYVNEGIGQVVFLESDEDCDTSRRSRRQVSGSDRINVFAAVMMSVLTLNEIRTIVSEIRYAAFLSVFSFFRRQRFYCGSRVEIC